MVLINLQGVCGMVEELIENKIYIVLSQTGTVLSRILKLLTKAEYNHVSIGLTKDLTNMYSFGRKNPYNPFWGGFVLESKNFGTFKRFTNTKILVISLDINSQKHKDINDQLNNMLLNNKFRYNYLGLCLAIFKINIKRKNYFYCSEFIKEILVKYDIDGKEAIENIDIPKPIDFLKIPNTDTVYIGKLKNYN